jgi:hypothetical protein
MSDVTPQSRRRARIATIVCHVSITGVAGAVGTIGGVAMSACLLLSLPMFSEPPPSHWVARIVRALLSPADAPLPIRVLSSGLFVMPPILATIAVTRWLRSRLRVGQRDVRCLACGEILRDLREASCPHCEAALGKGRARSLRWFQRDSFVLAVTYILSVSASVMTYVACEVSMGWNIRSALRDLSSEDLLFAWRQQLPSVGPFYFEAPFGWLIIALVASVSYSVMAGIQSRHTVACRCPGCGYELRGLAIPRCPECGRRV